MNVIKDEITCPFCGTDQQPFEDQGEIICFVCNEKIGDVEEEK